jgi:murein DD-endopeptidase MepM/ murein hydrolase activator NlpD
MNDVRRLRRLTRMCRRATRWPRAPAVVAAVLATTLSASSLAGGSPLPAPDPAPTAVPKRVHQIFHPPRVFPMQAQPEYGDGLDAGRGHEGQDMFAPAGTSLVAVANATVIETGSDGGRGNYVSIYDSAEKRTYNYFHMLGPALVRRGQRLQAGEKLGELGCTGSCWGDHLHFEVRVGRSPYGPVLEPMPVLRKLRAG